MSVFRISKNKNYTVMSNYHLREKEMSLKAKGLLSLMLSLPNEWDYSINGLVSICKENEKAIKSTLKELQTFGYLKITKLMPNKDMNRARIEYVYDVYEYPQRALKQEVQNVEVEGVGVQKEGQLNNKELNNKELNTNNKESKRERDTFDEIIERYTEDEYIRGLLIDWLKVRKVKRAANTNRAIELNINKLDRLAQESKLSVKEYLEEVIARGWTAFYKINDFNKSNALSERNNANKDYSGDWD